MLVDFTVNRDRGLLERMQKRDRAAFTDLYQTHHAPVHRFAVNRARRLLARKLQGGRTPAFGGMWRV